MIAYIGRPRFDQVLEAFALATPVRARRFFVMRQIAGHRLHEAIQRLAGPACAIQAATARVLDQAAQGRGRPARLRGQPFPMARQQGDLARHDTEARAAGATRRGFRCGQAQPGEDIFRGAAEVDFYGQAGLVVEYEDRAMGAGVDHALGGEGDLAQGTRGDQAMASKAVQLWL